MSHQLTACHFFFFAINFQAENITVGQRIVEHVHGAAAGHIFDIDDLFFCFAQGVRLKIADLLQPVAVVTAAFQQAGGVLIIERFPPQIEEHGAVLDLCHKLLHARDGDLSF